MNSVSRAFREQGVRSYPNLKRVKGLIELAKNMKTAGGVSATSADEVLRAAVVLMHATLEDFLRYVACRYLPKADNATLNNLPIKLSLATLSKSPTHSLKRVIREAIARHYESASFGNTGQIDKLLGCLGMVSETEQTVLRIRYPLLKELMDRRHKIVHEADLHEGGPMERRRIREIMVDKVEEWWDTVDNFVSEIGIYVILNKHYV